MITSVDFLPNEDKKSHKDKRRKIMEQENNMTHESKSESRRLFLLIARIGIDS